MTTTYPTTVDTSTQLYTAVNGINTTLSGAIDNSQSTIAVVDTTNFPTVGYFVVDTEVIKYTGTTATSFTGCVRGSDGSSAAAHSSGVTTNAYIVADHHNVLMNAIIAVETDISARFGIGGSSNAISVPSGVSFTVASQIKGTKTGAAATPAFSFGVDGTSGMTTFGGGGRVDIIISGADTYTLTASALNSGGVFQGPNGTVSNPTYQFSNAATTGFYLGGADICVAVAGTQRAQWEGNQYQQADGTVSLPAYSWFNDVDTGFYRVASNRISIALGGVKVAEFFTAGTSDDTAYVPLQLWGGGGGTPTCAEFFTYTTTGVTTGGGKTIAGGLDLNAYLFLIAGADGSGNDFNDVVNAGYYGAGGSPSVMSTYTTRGSPAARTYAHNSDGAIKLTMASGTYTTRVLAIGMTTR